MSKVNQIPLPLGYLEIQTMFARRIADLTGAMYSDTLWLDTDLPSVLGLGFGLDAPMSPLHPVWQDFLRLLQERSAGGVTAAYAMYLQRFQQGLIPEFGQNLRWFGCFSHDYDPDTHVVYVHFADRDESEYGPLSHHRIQARRSELAALFTHIAKTHPDAEFEAAGTWLFNRQEYLRLLPPDQLNFAQIAKVQLGCGKERSNFLQGSGLWGQFLQHGNSLHAERAAVFVERLEALRDSDDLATCFPLPMLLVHGPIQRWYTLYGIHSGQ